MFSKFKITVNQQCGNFLYKYFVKFQRNLSLTSTSNLKCCTEILLKNQSSEGTHVEKTSLYDFHVKKHGKIVNFAGYLLPVQYADMGVAASHLHTRKFSSIFDVSHMLQTYIYGQDAVNCFERICTADIKGLQNGNGTLTVFTSEDGTILDDLIVTKINPEQLYVVSNAAMKKQDMEIISSIVSSFKNNGKDVSVEFLTPKERALLAVQGPTAVKSIQKLTKTNLNNLYFMMSTNAEIAGVKDCQVTRCGYTGEDGVEISIPADKAENIIESILATGDDCNVKLAGLGARDSLRLEAGLCLYGSDIDATITPIEAALAWLVAKRRRQEENFPGAKIINQQLKNGVKKRRIGIRMKTGPPARSGIEIYLPNTNSNDESIKIGHVTSGCPSPSLGGNVSMGYIDEAYKKNGTHLKLKIREKFYDGEVCKMPFVPSKYYLKPK